eukprot:COSAG02_NODE_6697_length_3415_cov_2.543727_1_plen_102_part_00
MMVQYEITISCTWWLREAASLATTLAGSTLATERNRIFTSASRRPGLETRYGTIAAVDEGTDMVVDYDDGEAGTFNDDSGDSAQLTGDKQGCDRATHERQV